MTFVPLKKSLGGVFLGQLDSLNLLSHDSYNYFSL